MDQYLEVQRLVEEKENEIILRQSAFKLYHLFITGSDNIDHISMEESAVVAHNITIKELAEAGIMVAMRFKISFDNSTEVQNGITKLNESFYILKDFLSRFSEKYLKRKIGLTFVYNYYDINTEVSLEINHNNTRIVNIKFFDKRESVTKAERLKYLNDYITDVIKYLILGDKI